MVKIISEQGYPDDDQVLVRVEYFIKESPSEGGILIVGKDGNGRVYLPKKYPEVRSSYTLPYGGTFGVPVGSDPEHNHPAIYFPFELRRHDNPKSTDPDDVFLSKFDLSLMDDYMNRITLDETMDEFFKEIACWGPFELSEDTKCGKVSNHFWGEMYRERISSLEEFLEEYRR